MLQSMESHLDATEQLTELRLCIWIIQSKELFSIAVIFKLHRNFDSLIIFPDYNLNSIFLFITIKYVVFKP